MTDERDGLHPELWEQVLQSRAYFRIATEISDSIRASTPEIDDLSVSFSNGEVVISGVAKDPATIVAAMKMAAQHSEVSHVSSMLRVAEA